MGYIVECDGETIWEPSIGFGNMLIGYKGFTETVLGYETGISDIVSDEILVNKDLYSVFFKNFFNDYYIKSPRYQIMTKSLLSLFSFLYIKIFGIDAYCKLSNNNRLDAETLLAFF